MISSRSEQIRHGGELFGGLKRRGVVRLEVVAVRAVKDVHVPERRMVPLLDDFERLAIPGRNERPARFALVEEFVLGYLGRFGVVRDEDDFDVLDRKSTRLNSSHIPLS